MTNPHKITIKSDISELKKVEEFLLEVFEKCNISMENFNNVLLCISEAVINSIQHGNKNDRNKTVSVKINCEERLMTISVKDEGEGFDLKNVSDPTLKNNIRKESGRGIHIIRALTEQFEYNHEGNYVQFKIECE